MREAAALPLIFITAWEGLVDRAGVHVGTESAGPRWRRRRRAYCRPDRTRLRCRRVRHRLRGDQSYIKGIGAVRIDFRADSVENYVAKYSDGRGFDIVYDTVGGTTLDASFNAVTRLGRVVSALGWGTHALAPLSFRAASYSGVFTLLPMLTGEGRAHHGEILREATRLVEAGKVVPRVDLRHFALSGVGEAYRAVEAGDGAGKIVVDIG